MDQGQHATCCRSADPEIVASEPDVFDCTTCVFRQQVDGLDAANVAAWKGYAELTRYRWVWDMQAGPWWVQHVISGWDEDEREELMERIAVIYDTLHPPQEQRRGA